MTQGKPGLAATGDFRHAYRGTTVAVVGASGFIGRWVALGLARAGARLHALVRDPETTERLFDTYGIDASVAEADISHAGSLEQAIRDLSPAVVFNLAGYGVDRTERESRLAFEVNSRAIERMARCLAEVGGVGPAGPRLVHVGSALEYGTAAGSLREDTPATPTTLYGRSKLTGTLRLRRVCEVTGLRGITARVFTVYGPGEPAGRLLPSLIQTAREQRPLALTAGLQERDFTYVADVTEGLLRLGAADTRPGEAVNLATGVLITVRHFIETAAEVLGIEPTHLEFGALPTRPEEMRHDPVAIGRLTELTGWAPGTRPAEGIRRTVDFTGSDRAVP